MLVTDVVSGRLRSSTPEMWTGPSFGEHFLLAGQVMVKGVVKEPELVAGSDLVDGVNGLSLGRQGALGKAQWLDEAHDPVQLENGLQPRHGCTQDRPPALAPIARPQPS